MSLLSRPEGRREKRSEEAREPGAGTNGCGCSGSSAAGSGCSSSSPETGLGTTTRRDFLKVVGVTGAGAAVACGPPDYGDKLIPLLVQEDERVPGVPDVYATAVVVGPEPLGLHAHLREGRVIKLEGNPDAPNSGRLSALAQSALQDLYDPDRIPGPRKRREGGDASDACSSSERSQSSKRKSTTLSPALAAWNGPVGSRSCWKTWS